MDRCLAKSWPGVQYEPKLIKCERLFDILTDVHFIIKNIENVTEVAVVCPQVAEKRPVGMASHKEALYPLENIVIGASLIDDIKANPPISYIAYGSSGSPGEPPPPYRNVTLSATGNQHLQHGVQFGGTLTNSATTPETPPSYISEVTMMTSSNGNIFRVTGPLCGEFPGHRWIPLTKARDASFDIFFDLSLNKRLSKQSWGWWFETPSRSLWRHCNDESIEAVLAKDTLAWTKIKLPVFISFCVVYI